jgi:hypothetical protein
MRGRSFGWWWRNKLAEEEALTGNERWITHPRRAA